MTARRMPNEGTAYERVAQTISNERERLDSDIDILNDMIVALSRQQIEIRLRLARIAGLEAWLRRYEEA